MNIGPRTLKQETLEEKSNQLLWPHQKVTPPPLAPYPYPLLTPVHLFTTTFLTFRTPVSPVDESAFSTKQQLTYEHKGVGEKLLQLLFNK